MKQFAVGAGAVLGGLVLIGVIGTAAIGGADAATTNGGGLMAGAVPAAFLPWINKAAALCPQDESPALIAAQLWRESDFNANAVGPMTSSGTAKGAAQFTDGSWATWGEDVHHDGTPVSPFDVGDAVMAQGKYMCSLFAQAKASGYPGGAESLALAGYNAGWGAVQQYAGVPPFKETTDYVAAIEEKAAEWARGAPAEVVGTGTGPDAVRRASQYLGLPYVWGGGTPDGPSVGYCDSQGDGMLGGVCFAGSHSGFDCSSLVQNAWWSTVHLPRTAGDQYAATAARPVSMSALQPGDLIFYSHDGNGADAYHVVMYYGGGKVIEAPHTGANVQIVPLYTSGGLVGATRPV